MPGASFAVSVAVAPRQSIGVLPFVRRLGQAPGRRRHQSLGGKPNTVELRVELIASAG